MIRKSPMAGRFVGRTRSNAHKHINKFYKPEVDRVWIKNINKVEDNTNALLSYILCILVSRFGERLKYSSSDPPLFQTFYKLSCRLFHLNIHFLFGSSLFTFPCFLDMPSAPILFTSLIGLWPFFHFFFSHFPLLSLCKACHRTQSFLGKFLGHINYL